MPAGAKPIFVFAVIGDAHIQALDLPLRHLSHFSRAGIVVMQGRGTKRAAGGHVIEVTPPPALTDHQASLWLKTGLADLLAAHGLGGRQFCYLDSDVIAVADDVDEIFLNQPAPIAFAADHASIDMFSHWAVRCFCRTLACPHLREAMLCSFGIDFPDPGWTMWNGGVFVADQRAAPFLRLWHRLTCATFTDDYWQTRDQATLAATAASLGLLAQPTLPQRFNRVLDCHWGLQDHHRANPGPGDLAWPDFDLRAEISAGRISFLHLVNRGVGRTGWRPWEDAARLLPETVGT